MPIFGIFVFHPALSNQCLQSEFSGQQGFVRSVVLDVVGNQYIMRSFVDFEHTFCGINCALYVVVVVYQYKIQH